jgi:hypothetical protein
VGFGIIPFGTGPFGATGTIAIASAWATTTHGVRVTLTDEAAHTDSFAPGDATNPLTWSVANLTTGDTLTVAAVSMVDDVTVDLALLEPLGDDLEMLSVVATGLVDVTGAPLSSPVSATFAGLVETIDPVDAVRVDFRDRDLANPITQSARGFGIGGTLVIGDDGDFETESGARLLRKLVIRRMNTTRAAFRHLPDYGCATLEKEPIATGGDLVSYLREVERQAKQEPDAVDASARGSIDRNGVLIVQLAVTMRGGGTVSMRMGQRGGQIVEV